MGWIVSCGGVFTFYQQKLFGTICGRAEIGEEVGRERSIVL